MKNKNIVIDINKVERKTVAHIVNSIREQHGDDFVTDEHKKNIEMVVKSVSLREDEIINQLMYLYLGIINHQAEKELNEGVE